MEINKLNNRELHIFCEQAKVTSAWWGGRKVVAEVLINGKKEKIIASAKAVYSQLDKDSDAAEASKARKIFRAKELPTRDKNVFMQRLNIIQKIFYLIAKAVRGLDYSDTWKDKLVKDDYQMYGDDPTPIKPTRNWWVKKPPPFSDMRNPFIQQKIMEALNANFNGEEFEAVIVNVRNRYTAGLSRPESPYSDFHGTKGREKLLDYCSNPKVLFIDLGGDFKDGTVPSDALFAHYHISFNDYAEFENLPKISSKFRDFMKVASENAKNIAKKSFEGEERTKKISEAR